MGRRVSAGVGGSSNLGATVIVGSELSPTQTNANLLFSPNGTGSVVFEVPNNTTRGTFSSTGLTVVGNTSATGFTVGSDGVNTITEKIASKTSATGTVVHDYTEAQIFWHTSISANFTANFTNVPTTDNRNINFTLVLVQGGTGRYPSAVQVNGAAVTLRWSNNLSPTPSVNAIDIVSLSLFYVGSTWYCVGNLAPFA
jgi:hypothetical protein